jgi:hypothetical protein
MKKIIILLLIVGACLGVGWAAYQGSASAGPALSNYIPAGALLYLETKDFSSLLSAWNDSSEKQSWVKSDNYEVFSRSRLFLRLKEASDQFTVAAGLPPDMNFLTQVAGKQSAVALYDIGKLQFLYVTKLSSASSTQTALWQSRAKFETRSAGGVNFYFRRDPQSEREVAFAVSGDYLLLATREDLMAGALQLLAGSKDRAIEAEEWWSQSVAATGPAGDLRMVLNLEKIVPSPYFRSYWVQQNITDMKKYRAGVADLFLSTKEYREERVLLKKAAPSEQKSADQGGASVADLTRLLPANAGFYEAKANPTSAFCFNLLETKILEPHGGPTAAEKLAPQVQLTSGETGSGTDLETRIDQAPVQGSLSKDRSIAVKALFEANPIHAVLQTQTTERDKDGVFVRIHSAIALLGDADWNEKTVQSTLVDFVRPSLTAGQLGVDWQAKSGYQELDGLWTFVSAARGKYLIIADDPALLTGLLANLNQKAANPPAVFAAGFSHARERQNFARLTGLLDARGEQPNAQGGPSGVQSQEQTPKFFSSNIQSFSGTLSGVASEKIVVHEAGEKVLQTVTYEWSK